MLHTSYATGIQRSVDLISDQVGETPVSVATTAGRPVAVWELPAYGTDGAFLTVLLADHLDACEYLLQPIAHTIALDTADLGALQYMQVAA